MAELEIDVDGAGEHAPQGLVVVTQFQGDWLNGGKSHGGIIPAVPVTGIGGRASQSSEGIRDGLYPVAPLSVECARHD